ncbi:hypothetical protein PILCRDRAFT_826687 [Piloderma croceum F 1598]|uniref:Uncharacterized protein n=1 Tax=Piloderma croceum (strain F 1598) TaxID=765440 RepID=A0A0C3AQ35_PILCF|nr:hypothetical protein PILCRDRAFT_826687 [Piloderma croceum F 1598]
MFSIDSDDSLSHTNYNLFSDSHHAVAQILGLWLSQNSGTESSPCPSLVLPHPHRRSGEHELLVVSFKNGFRRGIMVDIVRSPLALHNKQRIYNKQTNV